MSCICDEGGGTYAQSFDAENPVSGLCPARRSPRKGGGTNGRLVSVTKDAGVSEFVYDGDGNRAKRTILDQNLAAGVWATSSGTLYWPEVVTDGDTWADSGSGSSGEFAYTSEVGLQYVQLDLGAAYTVDEVKVWHYAADGRTYHNTKTEVSADGVDWDTVFDSAVSGEYAETAAGKTHSFSPRAVRYVRDYVDGSTANAGNHWVEIEVRGSRTTVYAGGHYELEVESGAVTKYYSLAGRRVAMRTGGVLYYLHSDHLGSTSLTTTDSGALHSEQRYYPYGEVRWANGTLPTEYRFTGQRDESGIKLYDYKAQFYDPYLAGFLSPDTLVPDPTNPQDLNRLSYTRNNPVRYRDPTGHYIFEEEPDDPIIWRKDRPEKSLIRGRDRFDFYDWSQSENYGVAAGLLAIYGPAVLVVSGEVAVEAAVLAWGGVATLVKTLVATELADGDADEIRTLEELLELRKAYEGEVGMLKKEAERRLAAGQSEEEVARWAHAARRALGMQYKHATPPELLEQISRRNLEKYGDALGPSVDWLRASGKTWMDIIESAARPGGKDIVPKLVEYWQSKR